MHHVYLLTSSRSPSRRYVGLTANLKQRLTEHNSGKLPHTARFEWPRRRDEAARCTHAKKWQMKLCIGDRQFYKQKC
jgi:hypothetical protein